MESPARNVRTGIATRQEAFVVIDLTTGPEPDETSYPRETEEEAKEEDTSERESTIRLRRLHQRAGRSYAPPYFDVYSDESDDDPTYVDGELYRSVFAKDSAAWRGLGRRLPRLSNLNPVTLREYMDRLFLVGQSVNWEEEILDAVARSTNTDISHVDFVIKYLVRVHSDPAHHDHTKLLADEELCSMVKDISKVGQWTVDLLQCLNEETSSGDRPLSLDHVLREVAEAKARAWDQVAIAMNTAFRTTVMFTPDGCAHRFTSVWEPRQDDHPPVQTGLLAKCAQIVESWFEETSSSSSIDDVLMELDRMEASRGAQPDAPQHDVSEEEPLHFEGELLTTILHEVRRTRPDFQAGVTKLFEWVKIHADAHYKLRRNPVGSAEQCRQTVTALLVAHATPHHRLIARLTADQKQLVAGISESSGRVRDRIRVRIGAGDRGRVPGSGRGVGPRRVRGGARGRGRVEGDEGGNGIGRVRGPYSRPSDVTGSSNRLSPGRSGPPRRGSGDQPRVTPVPSVEASLIRLEEQLAGTASVRELQELQRSVAEQLAGKASAEQLHELQLSFASLGHQVNTMIAGREQ